MSETKLLNIYQRLNKAREAVAYLQKDKDVGGRYMAVTHDAVTGAVRKPFIEHGIMVVPHVVSSTMQPTGNLTAKGLPIWRYEAKFCISFVNIDQPEDRVEITLDSHALDEGDKAPGKATSYATKYAMLKLLSIETGEDDEGRVTQTKSKSTPTAGYWDALTAERQSEIADLMTVIRDALKEDRPWDAYTEWVSAKDRFFNGAEEEIAAWTLLDSKQRRTLKELHAVEKAKEMKNGV